MEAATTALLERQAAYRTAVLSLIPLRIEVKLVDLFADEVVRSVKRAADDAGPASSAAVFPGGVTPIVKPFGRSEVTQLRALEGRLAAVSGWAGSAEQHARVTAVRRLYETALTNRENGMIAAADARALRDSAKEDFLDGYAEVAAGIQQLFPRDRKRQDVFFEVVRSRAADDVEEEPVDDVDAPTDPTDPTDEE